MVGERMKGKAGGAMGGTAAGGIAGVTVACEGSVVCMPDPDCGVTITLVRVAIPSTSACTA